MRRVLLTGGRAAAALELARLLRGAGWRVVVAESLRCNPSRWSRAVARSYVVPWPNRDPGAYIDALLRVVRRERIDLLIPTCEEIFYVAKARDRLAPHCRVFTENIGTLRRLHSKWLFVQTALGHGLPVPPTSLLTSPDAARQALASRRDLVFKPVYSRFAAHTVLRPRSAADLPTDMSERRPWVAQDYIAGQQVCTYSVAHSGRLTVHSAYRAEFTFGPGAAIAFAALDHPATAPGSRRSSARRASPGRSPLTSSNRRTAGCSPSSAIPGRRVASISSRTIHVFRPRFSARRRACFSRVADGPRCTRC